LEGNAVSVFTILGFAAWVATWIGGTFVVDQILHPSTPWAMVCGIILLALCKAISGLVEKAGKKGNR
jgi:F0F1-type ATP synthase assembly protein I